MPFEFQEIPGGGGPPAARTPARFRERVIATFQSRRNAEYLRGLVARAVPPGPGRRLALADLEEGVHAFGHRHGGDVADSDPLAQRGQKRSALGVWGEVRRLNAAFLEGRKALAREAAAQRDARPHFSGADGAEGFAFQALTADSLRPGPLAGLNGEGPLHGWDEWHRHEPHSEQAPRAFRFSEGFAGGPRPEAEEPGARTAYAGPPAPDPHYDPDDHAWSAADPTRSAEQAMEEYYGTGNVETTPGVLERSRRRAGEPDLVGEMYVDRHGGWGARETRGRMRREGIPVWQTIGRRNYDTDIEDSLGLGGREFGHKHYGDGEPHGGGETGVLFTNEYAWDGDAHRGTPGVHGQTRGAYGHIASHTSRQLHSRVGAVPTDGPHDRRYGYRSYG